MNEEREKQRIIEELTGAELVGEKEALPDKGREESRVIVAKIIVQMEMGGQFQAYYKNMEEAQKIFGELSERLEQIKEYGNSEGRVYKLEGYSASYAVNLRKCNGVVLEKQEEFEEISADRVIRDLRMNKRIRGRADSEGLQVEYDEAIKRIRESDHLMSQ